MTSLTCLVFVVLKTKQAQSSPTPVFPRIWQGNQKLGKERYIMKTIRFLLAAGLMLAVALIFSCSSGGDDGDKQNSGSDLATSTVYCLNNGICTPLDIDACLEIEGKPVQNCPISSSSSSLGVSSSSSRQSGESSSSSVVREYDYCVFISDRICLTGPMSSCSSGGALSNSCPFSSSIQSNVVFGPSVSYGGETYQTVVIGSQTWFQRNLNYATAEGSKCYNNQESNCAIYGRLYDWATAMALPAACNDHSCWYSQISPRHQGICPSGWHIPSNEDWDKLMSYVDGITINLFDNSPTAGRKMKATSGWYDCGPVGSGNGYVCEDAFGFSALPGGGGRDGFYNVGEAGYWLSASENGGVGDRACFRKMEYDEEYVYYFHDDKSTLFSVRCLKD